MAAELTHRHHPDTTPLLPQLISQAPRAVQFRTLCPKCLERTQGDGIEGSPDFRHVNTRKPTHSHRLTLSHTNVCYPAQPGRGHRSPGKLVDLLLRQLPPNLPEKGAAVLWLHWWPCAGHCDLRTGNKTERGKELPPSKSSKLQNAQTEVFWTADGNRFRDRF